MYSYINFIIDLTVPNSATDVGEEAFSKSVRCWDMPYKRAIFQRLCVNWKLSKEGLPHTFLVVNPACSSRSFETTAVEILLIRIMSTILCWGWKVSNAVIQTAFLCYLTITPGIVMSFQMSWYIGCRMVDARCGSDLKRSAFKLSLPGTFSFLGS
jgi:hypothetical protein